MEKRTKTLEVLTPRGASKGNVEGKEKRGNEKRKMKGQKVQGDRQQVDLISEGP